MKILTDTIARLLFALPMLMFGGFHFMNAEWMAENLAPFGGVVVVYITGACLIAAAVSIVIKKKAALATLLLGVFLVLTASLVQLPNVMAGEDPGAMAMLLKDVALSGGAFFMSGVFKAQEETAEGNSGGGD